MKLGIHSLVLAGALATLSSCKKPDAEVSADPAPASAPMPIAVATPLAVATPAPDPLAPPGIFFLVQKASITTDDGIIGLKPGQGLRLVTAGTYEADGQTVRLRDDQVTNNLRLARQAAAADAASQAALRQALPLPASRPPTPAPGLAASSATPIPTPVPRSAATPAKSLSGGTKLGAGTGLADPETMNRRNIKVDSSGRKYWRDSHGAFRYDF